MSRVLLMWSIYTSSVMKCISFGSVLGPVLGCNPESNLGSCHKSESCCHSFSVLPLLSPTKSQAAGVSTQSAPTNASFGPCSETDCENGIASTSWGILWLSLQVVWTINCLVPFLFFAWILKPVVDLHYCQSCVWCHGLFVLLGWLGLGGMLQKPIL